MDQKAINRAAHLLLAARQGRYQIDALPADCRPGNLEDGYAVQQRLFDLLETGYGGWFLGGTNGSVVIPIAYGTPILTEALHSSPAELSRDVFMTWDVDVEFGFTMGADIAPCDEAYTTEEVLARVASLNPALDIVNAHFVDYAAAGWPSIIADNGSDGAVVRGPGISDWDPAGLGRHQVTLLVNGEPVLRGAGDVIMGNPVNALVWFANHMSERGLTIRAGEFISTGSCTEVYEGRLNDHVVADFGVYGSVEARFTP